MTIATGQTIWRLPGLGTRTATLVVAASDSSPQGKAQADYICDGIDDQVEIQAAIDALPAGGGKVLLLEGTYTIYARVSGVQIITVPGGTTLEGMGRYATIIELGVSEIDPSYMLLLSSRATLRNLTVDGKMRISRTSTWETTRMESFCTLEGTRLMNSYTILNATGSHSRIINNHFEWPLWTTEPAGDAIGAFNLTHSAIVGNTILQPGGAQGIDLQWNSRHNTVIGNTIKGEPGSTAIDAHQNSYYNTISGNTITGGTTGIILRENDWGNVISGNTISGPSLSIRLMGGNKNTIITGNLLDDFDVGVLIDGTPAANLLIDSNILISGRNIPWLHMFEIRAVAGGHDQIQITNNLIELKPSATGGTRVLFLADPETTGTIFKFNRIIGNYTQAFILAAEIADSQQFVEPFKTLLAASTTHIHPAIQNLSGDHTGVTSPDVPRNVSVTQAGTGTPLSGTVVVTGINARGNSITESIAVSAANGTYVGSKAFATVTKVNGFDAGVNQTLSVGISDKLGLSNVIYATGDVYKVKKGTVNIPVGAVDVANGTVDCATITGGDDFTVYYRSNLNILA